MSSDVMYNSNKRPSLTPSVFYSTTNSSINEQYNNNKDKLKNKDIIYDLKPTLQAGQQDNKEVISYRTATYSTSKEERFKFDVLLIYDPEQDYYNAQDLITKLQPQQLRIFDFAMECPPGKSQRQFFAEALNYCKYTCLVVTRNFITNFWLKFKADMAIQDMLQNEDKFYSLIVVVMDLAIKINDIPLELQTLSPIFSSGRFFEHRLSKAFAGNPFTQTTNSQPSSFQQKNRSTSINSSPQSFNFQDSILPQSGHRRQSHEHSSYCSYSDSDTYSPKQFRRPSNSHKFNSNSSSVYPSNQHHPQETLEQQSSRYQPPNNPVINPQYRHPHFNQINPTFGPPPYNLVNPTYQYSPYSSSTSSFDQSNFNSSSQTYKPTNFNLIASTYIQSSSEPSLYNSMTPTCAPSSCNIETTPSRLTPQEHSYCSQSSYQSDQQKAFEECSTNLKFKRMASVTQSSNGCRIPTETDDSIMTSSLPQLRENKESCDNEMNNSVEFHESEISQESNKNKTVEEIYDSPTPPCVQHTLPPVAPPCAHPVVPPVDSLDDIELEISVDDISLQSLHSSSVKHQTSSKIIDEKRNASLPDLKDTSIERRRFRSIKRSFSRLKNKFHS